MLSSSLARQIKHLRDGRPAVTRPELSGNDEAKRDHHGQVAFRDGFFRPIGAKVHLAA